MTRDSNIKINVSLNEEKVPQTISWSATDSTAEVPQAAKAMLVSFWDGLDKAALRIDLWTKEMMVDEMADFYFQCLMGMAETFRRSTGQAEMADDLQEFARQFFKKFQDSQQKK